MKIDINIDHWEADEYVLSFLGRVRGQTLHKRDAEVIKRWLETLDWSEIGTDLLGPKGIH